MWVMMSAWIEVGIADIEILFRISHLLCHICLLWLFLCVMGLYLAVTLMIHSLLCILQGCHPHQLIFLYRVKNQVFQFKCLVYTAIWHWLKIRNKVPQIHTCVLTDIMHIHVRGCSYLWNVCNTFVSEDDLIWWKDVREILYESNSFWIKLWGWFIINNFIEYTTGCNHSNYSSTLFSTVINTGNSVISFVFIE